MMGTKYINTKASDWTCPDPKCGNLNFARREVCNRCGITKPYEKPIKKIGKEIGKTLAEKSKGLFSAEDWQCLQCGNVNWARRNTCNICNSSKFGKVEERTGAAGGYNERESVEYIERDDSDSEYDEFGRKKKKFRGKLLSGDDMDNDKESSPNQKINSHNLPKKAEKNLNVSEEEDDDNENNKNDLSKYDLDATDKDSLHDVNETTNKLSSESDESSTGLENKESDSTESGSESQQSNSSSSTSGSQSDTEPEDESEDNDFSVKKKIFNKHMSPRLHRRFVKDSGQDSDNDSSPIPLPPPNNMPLSEVGAKKKDDQIS